MLLPARIPANRAVRRATVGIATFLALMLVCLAGAAQARASGVTNVTVGNTTPSAAAGARTQYVVGFVATTGVPSTGHLTVTFPNATPSANYAGAVVRDLTTSTDVGGCGAPTGSVSTCNFYNSNLHINASDSIRITFSGITNPATPASTYTVSVSTTSDTATVPSAPFSVVAANPVTNVAVVNSSPSAAAGARTTYVATYTTSATGGLSGAADSQITVTFPNATPSANYAGAVVRDLTTATDVGGCGAPTASVSICNFYNSSLQINAGDSIRITFNGINNPATAANYTLSISTTSDTATVNSSQFSVVAAHPVSGVTVAVANAAQSAITQYVVSYVTSTTGGLSGAADSQITVTFPTPTPSATYGGAVVRDVTTSTNVGGCGAPTASVSTCNFYNATLQINAGDNVQITFNGITNPATTGTGYTISVSTTSDTQSVPSGSYGIGADTVPPAASPTPTPAPTATPVPAPTPTAQTVVVKPVSGKVLVRKPGSNQFVELDATAGIPLGSTVDTRHGVVLLTSLPKPGTPAQSARFYDGVFKVTQSAGVTDLTLNEPLAPCGKAGKASAAAKKPKTRKLWGDGSGSFRTKGQYSAATVRGTNWFVQDSCAGTLTKVARGVVAVRDNVKHKTIVLRAGKSYLARPRHG
jgi:hypothetical protein